MNGIVKLVGRGQNGKKIIFVQSEQEVKENISGVRESLKTLFQNPNINTKGYEIKFDLKIVSTKEDQNEKKISLEFSSRSFEKLLTITDNKEILKKIFSQKENNKFFLESDCPWKIYTRLAPLIQPF